MSRYGLRFATRGLRTHESIQLRRLATTARDGFHPSNFVLQSSTIVLNSNLENSSEIHRKVGAGYRRSNISNIGLRKFGSGPAPDEISTIEEWPEHAFLKVADASLERISETVSEFGFDDENSPSDFDIELSQGVLTIALGSEGTYVLNTQTPNRQIWMSSPSSGPWRYGWRAEDMQWISTRDGHTLSNRLSEELSIIFKRPVAVSFQDFSSHL